MKRTKVSLCAAAALLATTTSVYAGSNMLVLSVTDPSLYNFIEQELGSGDILWTGEPGANNGVIHPMGAVVPQGYGYGSYGGSVLVGDGSASNDLAIIVGNNNRSEGKPANAVLNDRELLNKTGVQNTAIGFSNILHSYYGSAMGQNNNLQGAYNLGIGYENHTQEISSLGIGNRNLTAASYAIALGTHNQATAPYALVLGNFNNPTLVTTHFVSATKPVSGVRSVTLGASNGNAGQDSLVIGSENISVAPGAITLGTGNTNAGTASLAFGAGAQVVPTAGANVSANGTVADPTALTNAVALGSWTTASISNGVALGSYASASTGAQIWGYSPFTKATIADVAGAVTVANQLAGTPQDPKPYEVAAIENASNQAVQLQAQIQQAESQLREAQLKASQNTLTPQEQKAANEAVTAAKTHIAALRSQWQTAQEKLTPISAWQSTLGAVSIGDGAHGITRQLTGLAAGTSDTDAVNVAQLKALALSIHPTWTLTAPGTKKTPVPATIENGSTVTWATGSNLNLTLTPTPGTETTPSSAAMHLTVVPNPTFTTVTVRGESGTPIILDSQTGIQAGNFKITDVAAGTLSATSTDAVNGSQLYQLQSLTQSLEKIVRKLQQAASPAPGTTIAGDTTVVYTNEAGARVKKASDNAYYLEGDVESTGAPTAGATSIPDADIKLSLVNASTSTTEPTVLSNVAPGVKDTDAVNVSQLTATKQDIVNTVQGDINKVNQAIAGNTEKIDQNAAGIKSLQGDVGTLQNGLQRAENGITDNTKAIGKNAAAIGANTQAIDGLKHTVSMQGQDIASNQAKIKDLMNSQSAAINNRVANIETQVQELDNRVNESGSMAAALAAMSPMPYQPGETGQIMAGIGHYRNATAIALGYAKYPNQNTLVRGGLSFGNTRHWMMNAGVTFRLGRAGKANTATVTTDWQTAYAELAASYQKLEQENREIKAALAELMALVKRP